MSFSKSWNCTSRFGECSLFEKLTTRYPTARYLHTYSSYWPYDQGAETNVSSCNFVFRHGWIKLFLPFYYTLKCVGICLLCSRRVQRVMPLHCFIAVKHHWNNLKGNILEIFARKRNKLNWEVLRETAHKLGWKLEGTPKCVTIAEDLFESRCYTKMKGCREKLITNKETDKQTNKQTNKHTN